MDFQLPAASVPLLVLLASCRARDPAPELPGGRVARLRSRPVAAACLNSCRGMLAAQPASLSNAGWHWGSERPLWSPPHAHAWAELHQSISRPIGQSVTIRVHGTPAQSVPVCGITHTHMQPPIIGWQLVLCIALCATPSQLDPCECNWTVGVDSSATGQRSVTPLALGRA